MFVLFCAFKIEQDFKEDKMNKVEYNRQKLEVLIALRNLREKLTSEEQNFIELHSSHLMKEFQIVQDDKGKVY